MSADTDRSLARIEEADLLRLAALAADAEAELFGRNPNGSGRYAGRLLGRALCQGAALHSVNEKMASRTSISGSSMPSTTAGPSRLDGGERETSVPQNSADTPVTRRVTPADALIFLGARFRSHSALTRQMLFGATSPPGGLTRRKLWQPRPCY